MTGQLPYLTRLLVAIDRFEATEIPVNWGRALARALHLPITLIHVVDPARFNDDLREQEMIARDHLLMISQDIRFEGIDVASEVLVGQASEMLPNAAELHPGAPLLMAKQHSLDRPNPMVFGTSLMAIIQNMRSPYLLLPDKAAPERIENVVLGYDQSELASEVLRTSRIVASSLDVDVIAVEAVEAGSIPSDEFLAFQPIITPEYVKLRGRASRILLTVAQARDASLIAVGSHGAGESSRPMAGRTAEWLIQHSDRPILIVPALRN